MKWKNLWVDGQLSTGHAVKFILSWSGIRNGITQIHRQYIDCERQSLWELSQNNQRVPINGCLLLHLLEIDTSLRVKIFPRNYEDFPEREK